MMWTGKWMAAPDETLALDDSKLTDLDFIMTAPPDDLVDISEMGMPDMPDMPAVPKFEKHAKTMSFIKPTSTVEPRSPGFKSAGPEEIRAHLQSAAPPKERPIG